MRDLLLVAKKTERTKETTEKHALLDWGVSFGMGLPVLCSRQSPPPFGPRDRRRYPALGYSWVAFRGPLAAVGSLLGALGSLLGGYWPLLDRSWVLLGRF